MKKTFIVIISLFCAAIPSSAFAHERWFVNTLQASYVKPLLFSAWNATNSAMALIFVFSIIAAILTHFAIRPHRWTKHMRAVFGRYKGWVSPVLRTLTGTLLLGASVSKFLFAPDLAVSMLPHGPGLMYLTIQLAIGIGLIVGFLPRAMAFIGFFLYWMALFSFPFLQVFAYVHFAGIFAYLFIVGDATLPKSRVPIFPDFTRKLMLQEAKPFAASILRISAGVGFITVALMYKIIEPGYALEFIRTHSINFMPALGFANFSDDMFVMAAGFTEILLGVLLVLGLLPRLVGILLFVLFTLTLALFGMTELVGHLPLYAIAWSLFTQGGGERWSAEMPKKTVSP